MKISYDPLKQAWTLAERGLNFDDAPTVFAGRHFDRTDARRDYGEIRFVTFGLLLDDVVAVVWTQRGDDRRIISMRKAHDHERKFFQQWLDRP